uniref:Ubiquitin-like protease family profile domain-containing protein n=2 Tax=Clytia hemisphaerica TaxID=252671 RepID=A0A7M5VDJ6_9CNID
VGIYNKNDHWNLLIIFPKKTQLWLANPLGEGTTVMQNVLKTWQSAMNLNFDATSSWTIYGSKHAVQEDSVSCGVFCLKFLESFLMTRTLPLEFSLKEVSSYREKIGVQLLRMGGDGSWTTRLCRIWGRSDPPKCEFSNVPKMTNWVECENCIPERWFHLLCLGSGSTATKDMSYDCDKEIKKSPKVTLKPGELLLKRRKNLKISKCGACPNKINGKPLEFPYEKKEDQKSSKVGHLPMRKTMF